jgi:hypothetical protein
VFFAAKVATELATVRLLVTWAFERTGLERLEMADQSSLVLPATMAAHDAD